MVIILLLLLLLLLLVPYRLSIPPTVTNEHRFYCVVCVVNRLIGWLVDRSLNSELNQHESFC